MALPAGVELPLMGEGLTLEPLSQSHAAALYPGLRDERIYTYTPDGPPAGLASLVKRFTRLRSRRSPDGRDMWLNWAVRIEGGSYVGWLQATVNADHSTDIGYTILPPYWRKGYATKACRRMIEFLRADCAVTRLVAHVDTENLASVALLERLGFERMDTSPATDMEGRLEHRYEARLSRA